MEYLIGIVLPFFIDLVNRKVTNDNVRFIISLVACILVSVAFKWAELSTGGVENILQSAGIIFAESQAVSNYIGKTLKLEPISCSIEN